MGVTKTERADRMSTTTMRLCRAISSSDQAAKASVPPRTGSSTSPGPLAGMDTVTRPTLPIRLSWASADTFHRLPDAPSRYRYTTGMAAWRRPGAAPGGRCMLVANFGQGFVWRTKGDAALCLSWGSSRLPDCPPQRRVELWEGHNAAALIGLSCHAATPLEATEINVPLGRIQLARVTGSPHVVERTAEVIRRSPADAVAV